MFNLNQRQTSPNPFHNIRGQATVSKPIYPHRPGRVYLKCQKKTPVRAEGLAVR